MVVLGGHCWLWHAARRCLKGSLCPPPPEEHQPMGCRKTLSSQLPANHRALSYSHLLLLIEALIQAVATPVQVKGIARIIFRFVSAGLSGPVPLGPCSWWKHSGKSPRWYQTLSWWFISSFIHFHYFSSNLKPKEIKKWFWKLLRKILGIRLLV